MVGAIPFVVVLAQECTVSGLSHMPVGRSPLHIAAWKTPASSGGYYHRMAIRPMVHKASYGSMEDIRSIGLYDVYGAPG